MVKRILTVALSLAGALALIAAANKNSGVRTPAGNYNIPLWDAGRVPLAKGAGPLDTPFVTVFLPPAGRRNGGSVVIAPGGSNIMLMYGAEGMDIAERYNDWGVTAFVLTYRLSPRYNQDARILDGQRAIRLVRSRASELQLDPKRVGYIGFSAGSNMGRDVVNAAGPGDPAAADPIERFSSRPDYLGLVYGPGRGRPGEDLKAFPPTFLMCAAGDAGNAVGSAQLFQDLTKAGTVRRFTSIRRGITGSATVTPAALIRTGWAGWSCS